MNLIGSFNCTCKSGYYFHAGEKCLGKWLLMTNVVIVIISLQIIMSVVTIMVDVPITVSTWLVPIVVNATMVILSCLTNVTALEEVTLMLCMSNF